MKELSPNWVTEGTIDFEYKKYILLSYLQTADRHFNENKIYPFLADLIFHYRNLTALRDNKEKTESSFPQQLSHLDFKNFRIEYERMMDDENCLFEIESIVSFAIPKIAEHIHIGKTIYDDVEEHIEVSSVGLVPVNHDMGYLFFRKSSPHETSVYLYELTIFENMFEKFRGLKTMYVDSYPHTIYNYEEAIKSDLLKKNRHFPNPATYVLYCKKNYPFDETFFPVAKRRFVRFLEEIRA